MQELYSYCPTSSDLRNEETMRIILYTGKGGVG
ncbi:MAG: hypothetical protein COS88_03690, partial [Chloroflexi bacterium CG07_land_8_20_14_0_80_51_10]